LSLSLRFSHHNPVYASPLPIQPTRHSRLILNWKGLGKINQ
jgi:hypothetical protein